MLCSKFPSLAGQFPIRRECIPGRVYHHPIDGRCRIAYTPSAVDAKHALEGIIALAKSTYVEGATEIYLSTADLPTFTRTGSADAADNGQGINDSAFQATEVRKKGLTLPETSWGSAHQLGTCRMSAT